MVGRMKQRVVSTILLWAVLVLGLFILGQVGGVLLLATVSALAYWEAARMLEASGHRSLKRTGLFLALLTGPVLLWFPHLPQGPEIAYAWLTIGLFSLLLVAMAVERVERLLANFSISLALFITIPLSLGAYALIIRLVDGNPFYHGVSGLLTVVWLVAVAKFCDISGYLFGCKFGRTSLAPHYSPKKTWEGVLGGIAVSLLVGLLLWIIFRHHLPFSGALSAGTLAILVGAAAVPSDLLGSALKRFTGVKDSGQTIPGIGGALDLVDSLLLTAPLGYLYLLLFL